MLKTRQIQGIRSGLPFIVNHNSPQAIGLKAWWPMALGGGFKLFDFSGNGYHGMLNGGIKWFPSTEVGTGTAIQNDTTGFINCGDVLDPGLLDFTISCWVFLPLSLNDQSFMAKSLAGVGNPRYGLLLLSGNFYVLFNTSAQSDIGLQFSASGYADREWHHIAAVFNRAGDAVLYVDGIRRNNTSIAASSAVNMNSAYDFVIASYNDGSGNASTTLAGNAAISDARFYERALTDNDIISLYDPQSRYDLFQLLGRDVAYSPAAPAPGNPERGNFFFPMTGF